MTGSYRIRPVDGGDEFIADVLRELHEECFVDSAHAPNFDVGQWWIAYEDREPAGFAGITPSPYTPSAGYLKRAAVRPKHRGQGLQRRFITVRESFARRQGWRAIYTDTAPFNCNSSNNLFKAGYQLFRPDPLWAGSDWLYWRKRYA